MKNNNPMRAAVAVAIVYIVSGLVLVGGLAFDRLFQSGRNKKQVDQMTLVVQTAKQEAALADQRAADAAKLAKAAQDAEAAAVAAHAQYVKDRDQVDQNVVAVAGQTETLLAADPNPSAYSVAAHDMVVGIYDTVGVKLTPSQMALFTKRVEPILKHDAEATKALADEKAQHAADLVRAQADHDHALAAEQNVQVLAGQLTQATATTQAATQQSAKDSATAATLAVKVKEYADSGITVLGRLKAAIVLLVCAALVIGIMGGKLKKVFDLVKDLVAHKKFTEQAVETTLQNISKQTGQDLTKHADELKSTLVNWWENDKPVQAAISKVESKLRL